MNLGKYIYDYDIDHNSMFLSSNWLQESNINPLSYSILVKGYKDFRKKIQDRNVSKLLIGNNYQEQFDSWTKEIEWIAKSVEKKKKCKGRNIKKWSMLFNFDFQLNNEKSLVVPLCPFPCT